MDVEAKTIKACLKALSEQMDVDIVAAKLLINGIILPDNYDYVFSEKTSTNRRIALIGNIMYKDNGFKGLCQALIESKQKHLYDSLCEKYQEILQIPPPPPFPPPPPLPPPPPFSPPPPFPPPRTTSQSTSEISEPVERDKIIYYNYLATLTVPPPVPPKSSPDNPITLKKLTDDFETASLNSVFSEASYDFPEEDPELSDHDDCEKRENMSISENYPPITNESECFVRKEDIVQILNVQLPATDLWTLVKRSDGKISIVPNDILVPSTRQKKITTENKDEDADVWKEISQNRRPHLKSTSSVFNTASYEIGQSQELFVENQVADGEELSLQHGTERSEGLEMVKRMISQADIRERDKWGWTALQWAVTHGDLSSLKDLIARGADVNTQDNLLGNTALHRAARLGHSNHVKALIEAGANPNIKNIHGETALDLAVDSNRKNCVQLLRNLF